MEIHLSRSFDAPPDAVFAQWLDPEALKDWFAPQSYVGKSCEVEARVGGAWRIEFESQTGERLVEYGIYKEIIPARMLVMTLRQSFDRSTPELVITVSFDARGGGTLMRFHQTGFVHPAHRDALSEGWTGCFEKLHARLEENPALVAEIEALFNDWFDASERKDLDASMAPISPDIVSYEHGMPLEVRDVASMRAECKSGFDRTGPEFRWDVPDLQVLVRGDIAVT
jgi:uncharacterized protein YndB with AHSA1/START domain